MKKIQNTHSSIAHKSHVNFDQVPSVMESGNGPLQWVGISIFNTITIKLKKESFFTKALIQVRSLVRNVRSAEPGKEEKKNGKKKGKKGKGRKAEKGKGKKKGKKNGNKKKGARKGGNKGKGKGGNKKKGGKGNKAGNNQKKGRSGKKNGKKGSGKKGDKTKKKDSDKKDSNKKKGRSGKDLKLLPEFLYNQLWCFDLAMEQVFKQKSCLC